MDEQARHEAFMSALVTEHFVLSGSRTATIVEANGRAAIYLSTVSSALVALGFASQAVRHVGPFVAAVLPALVILGLFTFIRLVENAIENIVFLEKVQRIRGYYRQLTPEAVAFFDDVGADPAALAPALGSTGMSAAPHEVLYTAASMVAAVNAILVGAGIGLLVRDLTNTPLALAVVVSVVVGLVVFGAHIAYELRRGDAAVGWRLQAQNRNR
jgi:hypothetical protein